MEIISGDDLKFTIPEQEITHYCMVEHTRHRSVKGFLVNLVAGLAANCFFPKKPSLNITPVETNQLSLWAT